MNTTGAIIRYKRKKRGLTLEQLCEKLGVRITNLYNWEHDIFLPSAFNLCCLADFFECSVDELLGRTELTD